MEIKIVATANAKQARAQFAALAEQVEALNAQMARSSMIPAGGNPAGFANQARALRSANAAYNNALASSGRFRVETLKLNDAVDHQVRLLQKQKLSFRDMWGSKSSRELMKNVRLEQIAMQKMATTRTITGGVGDGRMRASMAIPTEVHKSWDTLNEKVGFFRHQLQSASTGLINWGKNTQWAGRQLMVGITMPVAAFGAAAGVMAYQVDKQLTRIRKVYDTTANSNSSAIEDQIAVQKELEEVTKAGTATAVRAAHEYGASITDTLEVQAELAATGQKNAELQKNTSEIMRISMLGEIDHQVTTKALIALQSTLGLTAKETGDAFNYMNAIENATSLTMADFAEAIPRAAAPIKEMGGDIKDLGLLLVAMKSRGIDAAEGANAIKAMMQRLYRPSKQIREEWMQLVQIDPLALVQENGGDIMKILPKIADAVKDLDQASKVKALAGLFGTYQVTRMSAMLAGFEDMKNGVGQMDRALEVNQSSWQEWAAIAEQEQKQAAESASGQFKRAIEGLKAELATIGGPFLSVATQFLSFFKGALELFNSMPDWAKKGAMFVAIFAALVGPLVMLIGLFANFTGNITKFVAWSLKLIGNMELLNKQQWANRVSASLAERGFIEEASAAELLERQLNAVAYAAEYSALQLSKLPGGVPLPPAIAQSMAMRSGNLSMNSNPTNSMIAENFWRDNAPRGTKPGRSANFGMSNLTAAFKTNEQLTERINRNTAAMSKNMSGFAVSSGVAGAAMVGMMLPIGEAGHSISQWLLMLAIGVPAVKGIAAGMKVIALAAKKAAIAERARAIASGASLVGARGAVAAFSSMMGPVGWTALAVGAIGIGVFKWWQHEKKITAEKEKQNRAIYDQKNLLADALDIQVRAQRTLSLPGSPTDREGQISSADLAKQIAGEDPDFVKGFKNSSDVDRMAIATKKYIDILQSVGGNANKAQKYVEALFIAAGDDALLAASKAQDFFYEIGTHVNTDEVTTMWSGLLSAMEGDTEKSITEQGTALGKMLADSMAEAGPGGMNAVLERFKNTVSNTLKDVEATNQRVIIGRGGSGINPNVFRNNNALIEKVIVTELAKQLQIKQDIATIDELRATWEYKIANATKSNIQELYDQRVLIDKLNPLVDPATDPVLQRIILLMAGFRAEEQKAAVAAERIRQGLDRIPKSIAIAFNFTGDQLKSILKDGFSGATSALADRASAGFDSRMNASLNATQAAWDNKQAALDQRQEDAMDAFDKRWDRRKEAVESYYDARIEAVDKAIEAEQKAEELRQRLFDAEMQRLQRLSEMENRTIDFNVALQTGDLDQAAKIKNDMDAQAEQWALSDAAASGARGSEKRVEKLENRRDNIEEQKDRAIKALEEREEAQRQSLERQQQANADALKAQADANIAYEQEMWDLRKEAFDKQLELLKSFPVANAKQLEIALDAAGLKISDFGFKSSKEFSKFFKDNLTESMRLAGVQIAQDNMWESLGANVVKKLIQGFGFNSMAKFKQFIMTGKLPSDFGEAPKPNGTTGTGKTSTSQDAIHSGGWVGKTDNRMGVARTLRGLHPSEQLINAKKGEFLVREDVAKKNSALLEALNSNVSPRSRRNVGMGKGAGLPGLASTFGAYGMQAGFTKAMKRSIRTHRAQRKAAKQIATTGAYVPGSGGWHKASIAGKGWYNSHDYLNGPGSPLYAHSDGVVVDSKATTSGGSPGNGKFFAPNGLPYRSYGETIAIRGVDGNVLRYAHLSPGQRFVSTGSRVKGGALIGLSGWTGNASGPHTHFDVNGVYNAREWMASHGIGLKKGGYVMSGGLANLHDEELVVDAERTRKMRDAVDQLVTGGNSEYNIEVNIMEPGASADEIADKVITKLERRESRKPQRRTSK